MECKLSECPAQPSVTTPEQLRQVRQVRQLIQHGVDASQPREALIQVLLAVQELLALPDNDFSWSGWMDSSQALAEIEGLLQTLRKGSLPPHLEVAVLFAATGPLQELSLSSGWAETFLKVAEKFDEVESVLWPRKSVMQRLRGWLSA